MRRRSNGLRRCGRRRHSKGPTRTTSAVRAGCVLAVVEGHRWAPRFPLLHLGRAIAVGVKQHVGNERSPEEVITEGGRAHNSSGMAALHCGSRRPHPSRTAGVPTTHPRLRRRCPAGGTARMLADGTAVRCHSSSRCVRPTRPTNAAHSARGAVASDDPYRTRVSGFRGAACSSHRFAGSVTCVVSHMVRV